MDETERALQRSRDLLAQIDALEERQAARAAAGLAAWQQPEPEPQPAPQRAQERPRRGPRPPLADEITVPTHDARGRIVSVAKFTGANASAAGAWEGWVRAEIRKSEAKMAEGIGQAIGEIRKEIEGEFRKQVDGLRLDLLRAVASIERMNVLLLKLERDHLDRRGLDDDLDRIGPVH